MGAAVARLLRGRRETGSLPRHAPSCWRLVTTRPTVLVGAPGARRMTLQQGECEKAVICAVLGSKCRESTRST